MVKFTNTPKKRIIYRPFKQQKKWLKRSKLFETLNFSKLSIDPRTSKFFCSHLSLQNVFI